MARSFLETTQARSSKVPEAETVMGELFRPMVPTGGSGPIAVEEATFTLNPGDMLELECAIPLNDLGHVEFAVEDESVVSLFPAGVRHLRPLSIVGGQPKEVMGMNRMSAIFQAQKEGETIIHLNLGLKQKQYKVKVVRAPKAY